MLHRCICCQWSLSRFFLVLFSDPRHGWTVLIAAIATRLLVQRPRGHRQRSHREALGARAAPATADSAPSPTACTGSAGGLAPLGQTFLGRQGWWRSKFKPLPTVRLSSPSPHRRREEDHREGILACGQDVQRGMIGPAHADLHRVDSGLSATPEPSIVACVPLFLTQDKFKHAQCRRMEQAPTQIGHDIHQTSPTSEEALDLVVGSPQLGGVHPESGPSSHLGLERQQTFNFSASLCLSTLTRPSVIAADGDTLTVPLPCRLHTANRVKRSPAR